MVDVLRFRDDEPVSDPAVTVDAFAEQTNASAVRVEPGDDARDLIRGQRGAPDATAPEQAAEEGAVLQLRRRQPGLQGDHGVALERLARATTTELQPHCQALQTTVDLTAFEPGDLPDWLKDAEIEAFYLRAIGERIVPAPQGLQ